MINSIFNLKSLYLLILSISLTPFLSFLETYIFCDWEFLKFLIILILGDTLLGFVRSYRKSHISSKGFGMVISKLFAYSSLLVVTHVLRHFRIDGIPNLFFLWFDDLAYSAIIVRESISILENIAAIYPKVIPLWLISKLKDFDIKGKLND